MIHNKLQDPLGADNPSNPLGDGITRQVNPQLSMVVGLSDNGSYCTPGQNPKSRT